MTRHWVALVRPHFPNDRLSRGCAVLISKQTRAAELGVALLAHPAAAAMRAVPDDTAGFVASCATNFEFCRNEVVDVSNLNLMNNEGCTFPHPSVTKTDSVPATHAIIDWLKANRAARAPKTDDAIKQAMAALWPSRCANRNFGL